MVSGESAAPGSPTPLKVPVTDSIEFPYEWLSRPPLHLFSFDAVGHGDRAAVRAINKLSGGLERGRSASCPSTFGLIWAFIVPLNAAARCVPAHTRIRLHVRIGSSTYWSSLHLLAERDLRWERGQCVWTADTAGPGQTRLNMERCREILCQSHSIIRPSFPLCLSLSLSPISHFFSPHFSVTHLELLWRHSESITHLIVSNDVALHLLNRWNREAWFFYYASILQRTERSFSFFAFWIDLLQTVHIITKAI